MKRILLCAALLCALVACSDDKSTSSSSSSSSSKSESKSDKPDKPAQPDKDAEEDQDDQPDPDKTPDKEPDKQPDNDTDKPVTDTTEPVKEQPVAERGFKESKQPEGDSLDGKELNTDVTYNGGERLKITYLGFSYKVPDGSVSGLPTGSSAIQVRDQGKDMLALLFARTGVTEAEARDMISQEFDLGAGNDQSKMLPVGNITKNGDRMQRKFQSSTLVGYADMVLGRHTTVGVLTVGAAGDADYLKGYGAALMGSVKFATPGGEKDRQKYEADSKGKCVHVFIYKSGGGGYGGASWSSETNRRWHLGSDHKYLYLYQHTGASSFNNPSAEGGHAADTNENHDGTWSIELTLSGAVLVLRDSKGVIRTHALSLKQGRLHVDGNEASVQQSDKVR